MLRTCIVFVPCTYLCNLRDSDCVSDQPVERLQKKKDEFFLCCVCRYSKAPLLSGALPFSMPDAFPELCGRFPFLKVQEIHQTVPDRHQTDLCSKL